MAQSAKDYKAHGIPASWPRASICQRLSDANHEIRRLKNAYKDLADSRGTLTDTSASALAECRRGICELNEAHGREKHDWEVDRQHFLDRIRDLEACRLAQVSNVGIEARVAFLQKRADELQAKVDEPPLPVPMVINCPMCSARHIDAGAFATKPHHTHSCQRCGFTWRPAVVATVGVQFLPGFKDQS